MNYTENYQLPQWVETDRIMMEDFNQAMADIDAGIAGAKGAADAVEDKETALQIHLILHDLPEPYKEVFQLRVFGELPFSQIGFIFGKTENWARVTYHRARMKIQERMEKHG